MREEFFRIYTDCGMHDARYLIVRKTCEHAMSCDRPARFLAAKVEPMWNEIVAYRSICSAHAYQYGNPVEFKECGKSDTVHWHKFEIGASIPMMWQ